MSQYLDDERPMCILNDIFSIDSIYMENPCAGYLSHPGYY
jgi:hypothetical protein